MQSLIRAIVANPYAFDARDFRGHCGLEALVRICQELESERPRLRLAA